jgi:alkanesulfonate monooxygenase SsuD/methylene tetrahydromethanopterin reductase-like flavin-dependent oxidoreductase (luciferase family)
MKLSFGLFGLNCNSGLTFTKQKPWTAEWEKIKNTVLLSEKLGFAFILPISAWLHYGGSTNPHHKVFDTFAFASALSQITKKIKLYYTVHVPFINPIFAAKISSTISEISNNRTGINLVCGWSKKNHELFGLKDFENFSKTRYDFSQEWVYIFTKTLTSKKVFNFKGKYLNAKNVDLKPKISLKKFDLISAAYSNSGREFAIKNCNIIFTTFSEIEKTRFHNETIINNASILNKKIKIYTPLHVVCKNSRSEAEDFYRSYSDKNGDFKAAKNFINLMSDKSIKAINLKRVNLFTGSLGFKTLIGNPKDITEQIYEIKKAKFDGLALGFHNYEKEIPFFYDKVMKKFI